MTDVRPNMQQLMNDGKDVDSFSKMALSQFEAEIVNYLFSRYNLPREIRQRMLAKQRGLHKQAALKLEDFGEEFPSFPIHLVVIEQRKVRDENPVHKIWMDFANRKFVKEFATLLETRPEGVETCGAVFHWGFLRSKGPRKVDERASAFVIHNREPRIDLPGVFRGYCKPAKGSQRYYLESLTTLLDTVDRESPGRRWSPDD